MGNPVTPRVTSIDGRRDSFPGATPPQKSDELAHSTIGPWQPAFANHLPLVPPPRPAVEDDENFHV